MKLGKCVLFAHCAFQTLYFGLYDSGYTLHLDMNGHLGALNRKVQPEGPELNAVLPHPEWGLADFCCKGPDGKCFRLYGPYSYSVTIQLCCSVKATICTMSLNVSVSQKNFTQGGREPQTWPAGCPLMTPDLSEGTWPRGLNSESVSSFFFFFFFKKWSGKCSLCMALYGNDRVSRLG